MTYIGNKLTLRRTGIKGKNRKVTPMSKGKKKFPEELHSYKFAVF